MGNAAKLMSLLGGICYEVVLALLHTLGLFLLPRRRDPPSRCAFYEGVVKHVRRAPLHHVLSYPVRYCLLDLDDPQPPACCAGQVRDRMRASEVRALAGCSADARVQLLLLPASAGYEQNPICVYYCRDPETGALQSCLVEVTNTPWADRVAFKFTPSSSEVPKPMHVSPLNDMGGTWSLDASPPGATLSLRVRCVHPTLGDFFFASLEASLLPEGAVTHSERWAWLMPHRVAVWIYWHAALLLWRGLAFNSHPRNVDGDAFKDRACKGAERVAGMVVTPAAGPGGPCGYSAAPCAGREPATMCPFLWRDATRPPWN